MGHANTRVSQVIESTWTGEALAAMRCPYAGITAGCRRHVNAAAIKVFIHFGGAIRQGRKRISRGRKWTIGLRRVGSYLYPENSRRVGAVREGNPSGQAHIAATT